MQSCNVLHSCFSSCFFWASHREALNATTLAELRKFSALPWYSSGEELGRAEYYRHVIPIVFFYNSMALKLNVHSHSNLAAWTQYKPERQFSCASSEPIDSKV